MASDKTRHALSLLGFCLILLAACGEENVHRDSILNKSDISALNAAGSDNDDELDFGEDWDRSGQRQTRATPGRRGGAGTARPRDSAAAGEPGGTSNWAIVLGTFAGDNHQAQAQAALQQMRQISSDLNRARIESRDRGSMVVYGRYGGPDDDRAQRDLARFRELTVEGRPIFGRSFITRVRSQPARSAQQSPHSLMAARQQNPNVHPLYTLQVAVWGDFDSGGQVRLDEVQRQAEAYTRELRSQGHEAYVLHDADKRLSIVTVGLFGRDAIDIKSGLLSSEVEYVQRSFKKHLVNGEEIREPINPRRPSGGTRAQEPFLVEVPR